MDEKLIFSNEYLKIYESPEGVSAESLKKGFSLSQLHDILKEHPEIELFNFSLFYNMIINAPQPKRIIGRIKERISVEISEDGLKAYITLNMPGGELSSENMPSISEKVLEKLREAGVTYGIKNPLFAPPLKPGIPYLAAEGDPPVNGTDCVIRMYELEEAKPVVGEDGKVDFYDLKLIKSVREGDWLGERVDATEGTPGKAVTGKVIMPVPGKNLPLLYDPESVMEVREGAKTVLRAKRNGAVNYTNGRISISNYLEVDGDVGFKTGNIRFDGYVVVKGAVKDGFSIEATRDIEINNPLGLGSVKSIISTGGSVSIRGGISCRKRAEIRAAKNVYVKFAENVSIECGGSAHIGFYLINSDVSASEVVFDSSRGQIIGGYVRAKIRVLAPVIGSEIEKRTVVEVTGFKRSELKEQLDSIADQLAQLREKQAVERQKLDQLRGRDPAKDPKLLQEYDRRMRNIANIIEEIKALSLERNLISGYLKAKGEGEISAGKMIFPNCSIVIKQNRLEITEITRATTYYAQDGELMSI